MTTSQCSFFLSIIDIFPKYHSDNFPIFYFFLDRLIMKHTNLMEKQITDMIDIKACIKLSSPEYNKTPQMILPSQSSSCCFHWVLIL